MMGKIKAAYIFPHPPIIIPQVGKGSEANAIKTIKAVEKASEMIKADSPTTVIVTSPHAPVFQDYIYISDSHILSGNLDRFSPDSMDLRFSNNTEITESIARYALEEGIPCGGLHEGTMKKFNISRELDHGAYIPLYFISRVYSDFKLVHISTSFLTLMELYRFGMCIDKAVRQTDEQVVFVASGDLSHRVTGDAPYGYSPRGSEFDNLLVKSLKELDTERLLNIDGELCESAGECGLRSFIIMLGALDGYVYEPEIYSYEAPYGVGYAVAGFKVKSGKKDSRVLENAQVQIDRRIAGLRESEDSYIALARKALETYVKQKKVMDIPPGLPDEMQKDTAGTFVSIKMHGQLRGCIGTISPTQDNIAGEIIQNAISAGTRDPRFEPVESDELDSLVYSVDILREPEPISSTDMLDVKKYGVIVRSGFRSGLLLPNLEGVETPQKQVEIALSKAGISPREEYSMERFEVVRHR
jgi:MEMO1 family protein